ncbi:MAG: hypothetical protein ACE5ID_12610, partial [Acidobacteriota bacterium]
QTFACASCHPEGHTDGLVWKLDAADGLRATMTVQEISETDPYHWDGSKCNFKKILQDGINFLMLNPAGPTDCEIKTMSDWMTHLVRPHSPFRPLDDSLTDEARVGLMDMHRGRFKDTGNVARLCNGRPEDPATEQKLLARMGDPFGAIFHFDGGGGPIPASLVSESCSNANCHVTPHWESDGFRQGNPDLGLIDGFQAVSNAGAWDRLDIMHDARPGRERYLFALDRYRLFSGAKPVRIADNYSGVFSTHGFNDQFFRHPEYNFDGDPATHAFVLTDAMSRFSQEEEELQTGAVGLTVVLDAVDQNDLEVNDILSRLITAASEGKIVLHGRGVLAGADETLTWDVPSGSFSLASGGSLLLQEVKNILEPGDAVAFRGDLLPDQESLPHPKLIQVTRSGSPILCDEGYMDYLASVQIGESQVQFLLQGIDITAGSSVLLDGQVSGAKLAGPGPDFLWTLPVAGGTPTIRSIQVMNPVGLQSNSVPLPVVAPVVAAVEPMVLNAVLPAGEFTWPAQFGITGPGTRFDVFRGSASDL